MKLTATKISEISKIFTTKTFNKGEDNERTISVFNEDIMNIYNSPIIDKFFELGQEVDDYHYKWLHSCLLEYSSKLDEYINTELTEIQYDDIEDSIIAALESDVYNCDLLKWISSNLTRSYYVDEALMENDFKTLWSLLSWAQLSEIDEVYRIGFEFVRWYLNEYKLEE